MAWIELGGLVEGEGLWWLDLSMVSDNSWIKMFCYGTCTLEHGRFTQNLGTRDPFHTLCALWNRKVHDVHLRPGVLRRTHILFSTHLGDDWTFFLSSPPEVPGTMSSVSMQTELKVSVLAPQPLSHGMAFKHHGMVSHGSQAKYHTMAWNHCTFKATWHGITALSIQISHHGMESLHFQAKYHDMAWNHCTFKPNITPWHWIMQAWHPPTLHHLWSWSHETLQPVCAWQGGWSWQGGW